MSNSVTRALEILELLAENEKPLALARISERLAIPKSTAHGIIKSLVERRFVVPEGDGYRVGIRAFEVGSSFVRSSNIASFIAPQLVSVTRQLEVTSHYAVLDGCDAVYLCKEDPPRAGVQLASSLGARLPSHLTAVGKACLAWLPADEVAEHVTPRGGGASQAELVDLLSELEVVRDNGFSTDDGSTAAGIRCVAAPVFDTSGPCGAIGVSFLRGAGLDNDAVVGTVVAAAARTSELLGGKVVS